VAFAEIGKFIDTPVKSYSSGMVMRLAFAVAINVDPEILVIDEALAVGDARFQNKCMARIREFKERCTILFVSHDMNAVLTLCDQVLWLNQGRTVMTGEPKEIARLYTEAIYEGVDKVMARHQARLQAAPPVAAAVDPAEPAEPGGAEAAQEIPVAGDDAGEAAASFGQGRAEIYSCRLLGAEGLRKETVCRGERLILTFDLLLKETLQKPIVGFGISNRLGLMIIGVHDPLETVEERELFQAGSRVAVSYDFSWPDLEPGVYSFTVAIADGVMEDHQQQHWIHEALMVDCIRDEGLDGMLGIDYSLKVTGQP
jgi:lipopolysaccharide transport system ATP-binding protein